MNQKVGGEMKIIFFGLLAMYFVSNVAAQDSPCGPESMKGPLRLLIPQQSFGADFRAACRAHDACYDTPGNVRSSCDAQFRSNLLDTCQYSEHPQLCRATARNMARSTSLSGRKAFERAQQSARNFR